MLTLQSDLNHKMLYHTLLKLKKIYPKDINFEDIIQQLKDQYDYWTDASIILPDTYYGDEIEIKYYGSREPNIIEQNNRIYVEIGPSIYAKDDYLIYYYDGKNMIEIPTDYYLQDYQSEQVEFTHRLKYGMEIETDSTALSCILAILDESNICADGSINGAEHKVKGYEEIRKYIQMIEILRADDYIVSTHIHISSPTIYYGIMKDLQTFKRRIYQIIRNINERDAVDFFGRYFNQYAKRDVTFPQSTRYSALTIPLPSIIFDPISRKQSLGFIEEPNQRHTIEFRLPRIIRVEQLEDVIAWLELLFIYASLEEEDKKLQEVLIELNERQIHEVFTEYALKLINQLENEQFYGFSVIRFEIFNDEYDEPDGNVNFFTIEYSDIVEHLDEVADIINYKAKAS